MNKWFEDLLITLLGLAMALFLTMGITLGIAILWIKDKLWQ
jgi:hypothetical protein